MNLINRELNYMYREFGTPKIELFYLDYTYAIRDMYGDITGGTVYVRKHTDLLGTIKTDPELLAQIYNNLPIMDVKQKALFKVSTKELQESGVLDEEGNWITDDDKTTGVLEGFLNMFIRYKGEFYGIIQLQPALIYRGEIGSMYITTSKTYKIEDYAGKAKVVIGDPPINRGEVIEVKSANPDPLLDWIDITIFNAHTLTPLTPIEIYLESLSIIPNLSTDTVLVIGDKVYNIDRYEETPEGDYLFYLVENPTLNSEDIVTREEEEPIENEEEPIEDEEEEPPVENEELQEITVGEPIYYNTRVVTLKDIYLEGRWRYDKQEIGATSTALEVSISKIPTTFKDNVRTVLNVYSENRDLFQLPNEVLINSSTKEITKQVVVVRDIPYVVISRTKVEELYRFELAITKYGAINLADIPLPPVPDTTPPIITVEKTTYRAEMGEAKMSEDRLLNKIFKVTVTDNSGEEITPYIEGDYDTLVAGTYSLTIVAVDSSGNRAEKVVNVIVADTIAPKVNGKDAEIELNSPALDEEDILALLEIDVVELTDYTLEVIGSVDTTVAGEYPITVKATDSSGNVGTKTFTITVVAPLPAFGRTYSNVGLTRCQLSNTRTNVLKTVNYVDVLADKTIDEFLASGDPYHVIRLTKAQALEATLIKSDTFEINIVTPFGIDNFTKYGMVGFKTSTGSTLTFLGIADMFPIDNGELYELHLTNLPMTYTTSTRFTSYRKEFGQSNNNVFID